MSLWIIRILFLLSCTLGGYAVSQVRPELVQNGALGCLIGFGFGGVLIALDEMLKGFSLRAFSAATFGLLLGSVAAWTFDHSGLFVYVDEEPTRWLIRLCLFLSFGYLGMVLALRSNKEDFSLIIPFVRFKSQHQPEQLLLLDTSAIIDGRVADLIQTHFLQGVIVVPKFVLHELQNIADSDDDTRRARGRRGLDILGRLQQDPRNEVKILEGDIPEEATVDAKLIRLAQVLGARLFTNDYNLSKIAELQKVACVNMAQLATAMKPVLAPGDAVRLRIVREGKDRGQGVGYLPDGTMVVANQAQSYVGQEVELQVQSLRQTGAGVIVFAELAPRKAPA
ncbi:MAG: hypothetical protein L0Z50_14640 [Verrucomicrobiales bacterium]|nr:hypothetical protein [Verrucomicrobiales bacterium]